MKACLIILAMFVVFSGMALGYSTADLNPIVYSLNDHAPLLNISKEMGINCIAVKAGTLSFTVKADTKFYFTEDKCKLNLKFSEKDFNNAAKLALEDKDTEAAKAIFKVLPFGQKLNFVFKCFASPTCRHYARQYM